MKTKFNITMILITSIVCILPLFFGILVYNSLPDSVGIPISGLDSDGNYNWNFHKSYFAFGMPVILLVLNIFIKILIYKNPKWFDNLKVLKIFIEWVVPAVSLFFVPLWLFRAMGAEIPIEMMLFILIGLTIIICGNYLPKSKMDKSSIFGIKFRWVSEISDENWIKGRRKIGYFWIIIGITFIIFSFLFTEDHIVSLIITVITIIILYTFPIIYAFFVYLLNKNKIHDKMENK